MVRYTIVPLILLLVVAVAVRRHGADLVALRPDESFSWRVSGRPTRDLLRDVAGDTHPPGHFLLLKSWQAIFGSSIVAMRALSAVCGGLAVVFVYLAVGKALRGNSSAIRALPDRSVRIAGLFAAALAAVHAGQVIAGQSTRMYALAALMAALTAWLLLKALHAPPSGRRWWWAYGVAVAGLLYSHHYGWFTLAAQVLFALGVVARRTWNNRRDGAETACGLLLALGAALALYSPWLPVFLAQARRVQEGFWVPAVSSHETWRQFQTWLTGVEYLAPIERWVVIGLLAASAAWRIARRDAAAIFFLLQAALPWAATLAISTWGERPLLQDRYLVMAQVALVAYVGLVCARLCGGSAAADLESNADDGTRLMGRVPIAGELVGRRRRRPCPTLRLAAAVMWIWLWGSLCTYGCLVHLASLPNYPPPIAVAATWLKAHHRAGDRLMTSPPPELNMVRYHLVQADMRDIDVRCVSTPSPSRGQESHMASIHAEDVVYDVADVPSEVKRVWTVNRAPAPRTGWERVLERTFPDGRPSNGGPVILKLYTRKE